MTSLAHTPTPVTATDCPFCEQVLQRNQELEDDKVSLADQLEDQDEARRHLDEVIRRSGMFKKPATFLEAVVAVCEDNHELRRQLASHRA
jgi:glutaredoxin